MSLKENLKLIKDEILEQETFLQSAIHLEKYYKKYKIFILSGVAILVGFVIFTSVSSYYENQKLKKANEAFSLLAKDYTNTQALEVLKQNNKNLYYIALFNKAKEDNFANVDELQNADIWFIKELSRYNKAIKNKDEKELDSLIATGDFLLKDLAIMNKALIQIQNKQYKKAKNTLEFLSESSADSQMAIIVKHFLIDK